MSDRYIVPLDLGSASYDKRMFYLRKFVGQKDVGKTVGAYIAGAEKK